MGQMNVLDPSGDIVVTWDPGDEESVKKAHQEWDRLKKDGYEFFEPQEVKGKRVKRFSKTLGKVIAAPGVQKAADKKAGTRQKAMAGGPVTMPLRLEGATSASAAEQLAAELVAGIR